MSVCVCTGAREAPGDVRAETESSTEISVQWSGLSNCRLVNGRITQYRVQYETCSTTETRDYTLGDSEDWNSGGRITLTGLTLTPSTNYIISVAAVNENGDVGLYSDPVTTMTHQCITISAAIMIVTIAPMIQVVVNLLIVSSHVVQLV